MIRTFIPRLERLSKNKVITYRDKYINKGNSYPSALTHNSLRILQRDWVDLTISSYNITYDIKKII